MNRESNVDGRLKDTLIELEQHLLKQHVRQSYNELDRYLADDFEEFTSVGFCYQKAHAFERLKAQTMPLFHQQDYRLIQLSDSVVLLKYRASITREDQTHYSLRSSIWKNNGTDWQMVFHQGTPCDSFELV